MGAPRKPLSKRTKPRRITTRPLTPKQAEFLRRYLLTYNASQAYSQAFQGCSYSTAMTEGSALLKDPRIAAEVRARQRELDRRYAPKQANVLKELSYLAFSDIGDMVDENSRVLDIHAMPEGARRALKKIKVREEFGPPKEDHSREVIAEIKEVEITDKVRPLHLLGLEEGMFAEKVEMDLGKDFAEALRAARARVAK